MGQGCGAGETAWQYCERLQARGCPWAALLSAVGLVLGIVLGEEMNR